MKKIVNGEPVDMTPAEVAAFTGGTAAPPASVTPRQMRLALLQLGLMDEVDGYVASLDAAAIIEWEYATAVERGSPLIAAAAAGMALTTAQVDDLFRLAAAL